METGSVSFKNSKLVKLIHIDKDKDTVKAIIKTKDERFPEFEKDYREYLRDLEREKNSLILKEKIAVEEEEKEGKAKK
jgi:hypothetical protein